ncbi:MAG: hypothetical protein ACKV2T_01875 [Kofleriaceae bacterium]
MLASGGIDSEVVLQSFVFANIPVTAAILRFSDGSNFHDIRYAIRFCETYQVPYRLLSLDIETFLANDALAYAERTQCVHAMLLATMWAMDQVDGFPILGSGECYLVRGGTDRATRGLPDHVWGMHEKERIASWFRHLVATRRDGCAGFFQYTAECILAFLVDPEVATLCTGRGDPAVTNTATVKHELYRSHFLLEPRPKYHGYENVMHAVTPLAMELQRRYHQHDAIACTPYQELLVQLAPPATDHRCHVE